MRGPRRGSAFRVPRRLHLGPRRGVPRAATRASNFQRSPARAFAAPRLEFANFEPLDPKTPRACREPFPRRTRRAARAHAHAPRRPSRSSRRRSPVQGIFRPPLPPARRERPRPPPARHPRVRPPSSARPVSARHVLGLRAPERQGRAPPRADQVPHRQTRAARRPARPPRGPLRARALPQAVLPHGRISPRSVRGGGREGELRRERRAREETRQVRRASPRELPRASHGMRPLRLRPEMVVLRRVLRRVHGVVPRRIPRARRGGRGRASTPGRRRVRLVGRLHAHPRRRRLTPRGTAIGTRRTPRTRGRRPRFSLVHRGVRARRADGGGLT